MLSLAGAWLTRADIIIHSKLLSGEPFKGAHELQVPPLDFGSVMCILLVNGVLLELAEGGVWEQGGLVSSPTPLLWVTLGSWIILPLFQLPGMLGQSHMAPGGAGTNTGWKRTESGTLSVPLRGRCPPPMAG